jgi:peptide/nickel transport system permease protein
VTKSRGTAISSAARPQGRRRASVGAVLAASAIVYTGVALLRAPSWTRFTAPEAGGAAGFAAALFVLSWRARRETDPERLRLRRRFESNTAALVALAVLIALSGVVALAPALGGADPLEVGPVEARYAPPSASHPMGTDRFARDVWSRVAHGGRATFALCVLAVGLAVVIGTAVGAVAGVAHPRADDALMRVVDGMLAFPRILLLLTVVALAPPGALTLGIALAATGWMGIARIVRGEMRRMRSREFVEAAVAAGAGRARLVWRHMLPNTTGHVIVAATLNAGTVVVLESSLSFLGLGIQPPAPSWGAMVFEGRDALAGAWWVSAFPALAITTAVVALNVVGDGLRDALQARDPGR